MNSFWAVTRASFAELKRDPLSTFFSLVFPLFFLIMFWFLPSSPDVTGRPVSGMAFGVPAVLTFALLNLGSIGTAAMLTQTRKDGALRSLGMTPLRREIYLLGQVPGRAGLAVAMALLLMAVAAVTGVLDLGRWWWAVLGLLWGLACSLALGLAAAARTTNVQVVGAVSGLLCPVLLMVCGVFLPLTILPSAVGTVARFLPFTYVGDWLRAGLTGQVLQFSWLAGLAVCTVWTGLAGLAAWYFFRWEGGRS